MRELAINFIKALRIGMPFWKLNKRLKLIIANGDIVDIRSASQALKVSETDGLMIVKAMGKP